MKLLIVEDQVDARDGLIRLCERSEDVQVVGEAACGKAAIDAADVLNPDIMLLDVQLPDMSGFDLFRAVRAETHPVGIMVSSSTDHAARAFAEGALDYLVTPVAAERFDQAIARARHRFNGALSGYNRFDSQLAEFGRLGPAAPRFLVGERQRKLYPLDPKAIDYIEADGNYVTLRVGKVEYLSRDSIKRLFHTTCRARLHSNCTVLAGECRRGLLCRAGRARNICLNAHFRCLPAFDIRLPRLYLAHYPAAGLVQALRRDCVLAPNP